MKLRLARQPDPEDDTDEAAHAHAAAEADAPPPGPDLLFERSLLAGWYVRYQLEKEIERARRYERPLSIMVLTPVPSLGERPSDAALAAAAAAARNASRTTDLIGWLPHDRIIVVLPETDRDGAAAAVHRWRTEMYSRTLPLGSVRWAISKSVDPFGHESVEALLDEISVELV